MQDFLATSPQTLVPGTVSSSAIDISGYWEAWLRVAVGTVPAGAKATVYLEESKDAVTWSVVPGAEILIYEDMSDTHHSGMLRVDATRGRYIRVSSLVEDYSVPMTIMVTLDRRGTTDRFLVFDL